MTIRDTSFQALIQLLKQKSGLIITPDKLYLVESRLRPVAELLGFPDLARFVDHLALAPSERAVQLTVEAMATHETSFFRDGAPFQRLKDDLLPALLRARTPGMPLRFLCAACSSGQEPLSLAMLLDEMGILGGMLSGTFLAIFFVPVFFVFVMTLVGPRKARTTGPAATPAPLAGE